MNKLIIFLISILLFCCTSKNENIVITSTNPVALSEYNKGIELAGLLKLDEAETAFAKAIELDSTFAMAYLELAMVRDDYDTRPKLIAKAMGYLDAVSEGEKLMILGKNKFYGTREGDTEYDYYKRLVELYPNDDRANYGFGFINVHHGQHVPDSAIHYYKKAIKLNPNNSTYYSELANAYLLKQDFKNAEQTINEHIAFLPNHEDPKISYAELLLKDHRYAESFKAYESVLDLNPKAAWAIIGASNTLNYLGEFVKSRQFITKLDSIPLSDYEYRHKWRAKTCSYLVEGKLDSVIIVLKQQKEETDSGINTREPLFHQYYSMLRATQFYFENNQPDEGLESYAELKDFVVSNISRESTVNNTKNLELYYKVYAAFLKGSLAEAKQILDAIENKSDDEKLLSAKLLLANKAYNQAITLIKQLESENAYYQYWLAEAYRLNNQKSEYDACVEKIKGLIEIDNLDYALVNSLLQS